MGYQMKERAEAIIARMFKNKISFKLKKRGRVVDGLEAAFKPDFTCGHRRADYNVMAVLMICLKKTVCR
jgi:hypothetical protein